MFKKIVGIIGALTSFGAIHSATAAPAQSQSADTDTMEVRSYADLLKPIPNAVAMLRSSDLNRQAQQTSGEDQGKIELAQYHHHHHHHHWRRWHHHHHHHWFRHHHHHHHY